MSKPVSLDNRILEAIKKAETELIKIVSDGITEGIKRGFEENKGEVTIYGLEKLEEVVKRFEKAAEKLEAHNG